MNRYFFEEHNIDNMLYTKNHRDMYTLFFINKFMNKNTDEDPKKRLKIMYKIQLDKKVEKIRRHRQNENKHELEG